jgi:hypothetical protein
MSATTILAGILREAQRDTIILAAGTRIAVPPDQSAAYWQELENGSPHRARREILEWQIRKAEKRLAEVEAGLAKLVPADRA